MTIRATIKYYSTLNSHTTTGIPKQVCFHANHDASRFPANPHSDHVSSGDNPGGGERCHNKHAITNIGYLKGLFFLASENQKIVEIESMLIKAIDQTG